MEPSARQPGTASELQSHVVGGQDLNLRPLESLMVTPATTKRRGKQQLAFVVASVMSSVR
jgi:hypothetical protein